MGKRETNRTVPVDHLLVHLIVLLGVLSGAHQGVEVTEPHAGDVDA